MAKVDVLQCDGCRTTTNVFDITVTDPKNDLRSVKGDFCPSCLKDEMQTKLGVTFPSPPPKIEVREVERIVYRDSNSGGYRSGRSGATGRPLQIEGETITSPVILYGSDRLWAKVEAEAQAEAELPNRWD